MSMDFEVHCMFILPTELSLFIYDKVKSVLQSVTPLIIIGNVLVFIFCYMLCREHDGNWVCSAFGKEHNLCSLTYILLFLMFIFPPLRMPQYLDYIENVGVKRFVLVAIELLVSELTFRCMV